MDTLGSSTPPRAVFEAAQRHGSILVTSASLRRKGWVVGLKAVGLVWSVLGHRGGPRGAPRRSHHLQRQGREEEVPGRPRAELYHRLQPYHASEPPNRRHGLPRPRTAAIPPIRCGTRAIDEACSVIMVCAAPAAARRALAGCLTAAHGGGGRSRSSRAAQRSTSSISAAECANLASAGFAHCANPANVVILTSRSM